MRETGKELRVSENFWFDYQHVKDHGCLFNFIVGERGNGKTYGFKKTALNEYFKTGKKFMYIRRYDVELTKSGASFFRDIGKEYPDYTFEFKTGKNGANFFCRNDSGHVSHIGYASAVTTGSKDKSISYDDVGMMCFDEFIAEKGPGGYIRDEVRKFLNLYETVARMRDVPIYFLANALTAYNPYFEFFNVTLPYNKTYSKKGDIYIEVTESKKYRKAKKESRFGKIIEGTEFAEFAIDNKFYLDSTAFVCRKTANCKPYHTIYYQGSAYGLWWDVRECRMFLSRDTDPSCKFSSALTAEDHSPNRFYYKNGKSVPWLFQMIKAYENGYLFFETQAVKSKGMEIIKFIRG